MMNFTMLNGKMIVHWNALVLIYACLLCAAAFITPMFTLAKHVFSCNFIYF